MGGAIHFGLWEGDADDADFETAADRMTVTIGSNLDTSGPGKRIIDVGCSTGKPAVQISSSQNFHVTGSSISSHQIELARALAAAKAKDTSNSPQVTFQRADAMTLPFADGSFDGAYAIEPHLADAFGSSY
ncbi:class I SAM-dependent methyltransferase [Aspergillus stella-maris]|uniref:class I SAM-dependent methyltransferase n=1 Tax=Aspergillus stella-maris TaxID=1810926 RepID=UPI003CCCFD5D